MSIMISVLWIAVFLATANQLANAFTYPALEVQSTLMTLIWILVSAFLAVFLAATYDPFWITTPSLTAAIGGSMAMAIRAWRGVGDR